MMIVSRTSAALVISLVVLPGMFGQPKSDQPVKPVTVCDVLGDLSKYSGQDVAILGRLELRHWPN
jgi:hypothetical protein